MPSGFLDRLFRSAKKPTETDRKMVAIDEAADAIFAARKVCVFTQGHALSLAQFLSRRLARFGKTTALPTGRGRDVAERLIPMSSDDIAVAPAFAPMQRRYRRRPALSGQRSLPARGG